MRTVLFLVLGICILSTEEVGAQTAPTASSSRRTYPGGRDDADLTVQAVRKITRKGDDVEIDYHPSEPSEGGAVSPGPTPASVATPAVDAEADADSEAQ